MFIMLCKLILTVMCEDEVLVKCVTIQMKAIEQYFHVVLFIMLYKVILTFKSVGETLVCDHSNEMSSTFIWYCLFSEYNT